MNNAFSLRTRLAANASAQPQDVLAAKTLLQRLGYYEAPEWGLSPYPDAALFKAVRAFQTAQGLDSDGAIKPDGETEAALCDAAKHLQSMGRNGDTLLAHITPAEARLLDAVTDGGSINPTTGLLEFWGRMGGSNYSREQRDKTGAGAETRTASLGGDTGNNTQNEGGGSRQKTYTDAQLAGAAKANEEAARTREKVRSYLGRNGASGNDGEIARAEARTPQQANASQPAELTRPRAQDTTAAAIARGYAAAKLNKNPSGGLLTPKAATPTPTPTTAALSSSMHRAQNAAAATTTATTATATTPADPGVDPSWGPSATPAQQARNIKQTRQFSEQQRTAEANANAVATRTRQTSRDYLASKNTPAMPTNNGGNVAQTRAFNQQHLNAAAQANKVAEATRLRVQNYLSLMAQTPATPKQAPVEARKTAWNTAKKRVRSDLLTKPIQPSFNDAIAQLESYNQPNNGYGAITGNPKVKGSFAIGRYQMRGPALQDTGYLDDEGNWTGKNNIWSHQDFLNHPTVQDKAFQDFSGITEGYLKNNGSTKHLGQEISGVKAKIKITRSGLIAAALRQGKGNVKMYLDHLQDHAWKSDPSTFKPELRDTFLSIETRLREFQNNQLP